MPAKTGIDAENIYLHVKIYTLVLAGGADRMKIRIFALARQHNDGCAGFAMISTYRTMDTANEDFHMRPVRY